MRACVPEQAASPATGLRLHLLFVWAAVLVELQLTLPALNKTLQAQEDAPLFGLAMPLWNGLSTPCFGTHPRPHPLRGRGAELSA